MGRKERLNEVYEYVRNHFPIHTQVDFAEKLKYHRTYISSAMHGNEKNLTDKLFTNICEAFPGVFDLDYLLTGDGTLLAMNEQETEQTERKVTPATDEMTANTLEMYARMIRGVDDLRLQIQKQMEEVQSVKAELQQARDDFRNATAKLIAALERIKNP